MGESRVRRPPYLSDLLACFLAFGGELHVDFSQPLGEPFLLTRLQSFLRTRTTATLVSMGCASHTRVIVHGACLQLCSLPFALQQLCALVKLDSLFMSIPHSL